MESFLNFYQNIPLHINPTAFGIGFFQIGWYPLSYLVGFLVVYRLLIFRIKRGEGNILISNLKFKISKQIQNPHTYRQAGKFKIQNLFLDAFFIYAIFGVLIGGRLGYVLFYNLPYYLSHPLEIISPYDFVSHAWIGIYGMSYHGGLIGVLAATAWFCRKNKLNFWRFSDFVIPAIPLGYFFGRIGNFLNGELYGRITKSAWGMYFFDGNNTFLRFPSQILEALFEGIFIFFILWLFRNKSFLKGKQLFSYIILYGLARFLAEFSRQPDEQIGFLAGFLTLGQIFSLAMILAGLLALIFKKYGIIEPVVDNT
jgi:phosphatidylglycerol---prolipoprotein diacylglyceryl transferase